jgi:hypothetical protein
MQYLSNRNLDAALLHNSDRELRILFYKQWFVFECLSHSGHAHLEISKRVQNLNFAALDCTLLENNTEHCTNMLIECDLENTTLRFTNFAYSFLAIARDREELIMLYENSAAFICATQDAQNNSMCQRAAGLSSLFARLLVCAKFRSDLQTGVSNTPTHTYKLLSKAVSAALQSGQLAESEIPGKLSDVSTNIAVGVVCHLQILIWQTLSEENSLFWVNEGNMSPKEQQSADYNIVCWELTSTSNQIRQNSEINLLTVMQKVAGAWIDYVFDCNSSAQEHDKIWQFYKLPGISQNAWRVSLPTEISTAVLVYAHVTLAASISCHYGLIFRNAQTKEIDYAGVYFDLLEQMDPKALSRIIVWVSAIGNSTKNSFKTQIVCNYSRFYNKQNLYLQRGKEVVSKANTELKVFKYVGGEVVHDVQNHTSYVGRTTPWIFDQLSLDLSEIVLGHARYKNISTEKLLKWALTEVRCGGIITTVLQHLDATPFMISKEVYHTLQFWNSIESGLINMCNTTQHQREILLHLAPQTLEQSPVKHNWSKTPEKSRIKRKSFRAIKGKDLRQFVNKKKLQMYLQLAAIYSKYKKPIRLTYKMDARTRLYVNEWPCNYQTDHTARALLDICSETRALSDIVQVYREFLYEKKVTKVQLFLFQSNNGAFRESVFAYIMKW